MEPPARRSSRYGTRVAAALAQQVICDLVSYDEVASLAEEVDEEEDRITYRRSSSERNDYTTTIKQIKTTKGAVNSSLRRSLMASKNYRSSKAENSITTITPISLTTGHPLGSQVTLSGSLACSDSPTSMALLASSINTATTTVTTSNQSLNTKPGQLLDSKSLYFAYQTWALKTYGDSAKTKTVTRKKYQRIVRILKGEESTNVENSKFRFWVKAKGFKLRSNPTTYDSSCDEPMADRSITNLEIEAGQEGGQGQSENILLVPCTKSSVNLANSNGKGHGGGEIEGKLEEAVYKKVAVVENFYRIIYNVHVEMDGRSGKHAGQKRTYRAVAEMYAFLPREAVTRFLMSCSDCQKRMHLQGINNSASATSTTTPPIPTAPITSSTTGTSNGNNLQSNHHPQQEPEQHHPHHSDHLSASLSSSNSYQKKSSSSCSRRSNNSIISLKPIRKSDGTSNDEDRNHHLNDMDFSLPITVTYLKRMKSMGYNCNGNGNNNNNIDHLNNIININGNNKTNNHIDQHHPPHHHGIFPYTVICDQATPFNHSKPNQLSPLSPIENGHGDEPISGSEYNSEGSIESNDGPGGGVGPVTKLEVDDDTKPIEGCHQEETNPISYNNGHQLVVDDCELSSPEPIDIEEMDSVEPSEPSGPLDMSKLSRRSSPEPLSINSHPKPSASEPTNHLTTAILTNKSRSPVPRGIAMKRKVSSTSPKGFSSPSKDSNDQGPCRPEKMAALHNINNGVVDEITPTSDYTLKEEEEDDDDDEEADIKLDDKTDTSNFDPERLKAFNMFVRLFVDENLDRMVPISRQPKDKIQAIIQSCMRQFPEFSDRARKRIRTYLKSCRRTRRSKVTVTPTIQSPSSSGPLSIDGSSKDGLTLSKTEIPRNTTSTTNGTSLSSLSASSFYHLTSPIAEQILASACAHESYNAKRMRAGLKPLPGNSISPSTCEPTFGDHFTRYPETKTVNDNLGSILPSTASPSSESAVQVLKPSANSSLNSTLLVALTGHQVKNDSADSRTGDSEPLMLLNKKDNSPFRSEELENISRQANQSCSAFNRPGSLHTPPSLAPLSPSFTSSSPGSGSNNTNKDPTIINCNGNGAGSSSSGSNRSSNHPLHPQPGSAFSSSYLPYSYLLSPGETAAIKTLIAGYRESAAFLLRSANELEHLLLQQT